MPCPGAVIGVGVLIAARRLRPRCRRARASAHRQRHRPGPQRHDRRALLYAYLVRFFAVGFNPLEAGLAKIAPGSGRRRPRRSAAGPSAVAGRVHLPLLRPSLISAVLLVLVDVMKELPATLILRPFNFDTLAVEAFQLATTERLDGAALPSLVIVAVGLVPVVLLCRMLDRGRGVATPS